MSMLSAANEGISGIASSLIRGTGGIAEGAVVVSVPCLEATAVVGAVLAGVLLEVAELDSLLDAAAPSARSCCPFLAASS